MSSLHTINKSIYDAPRFYQRLFDVSAGDAILLIDAAVVALASPLSLSSFVAKCEVNDISVYALASDVKEQQVVSQQPQVKVIDVDAFVELVEQHDKQVAW